MGTDAAPLAGERVDGRHLRREANREAVIEAVAALHREGVYDASLADVAARAGVSQRSMFRYFNDADDLVRTVIERQVSRALPLATVDLPPEAPTAEKVDALAAARVRLFEEIGHGARAVRARAHVNPVIDAQLRNSRAALRSQLAALFAPELAAMQSDAAGEVLAACDVACSFEAYDLLRHDQRLSKARATAALRRALAALLAPAG